MENKYLKNLISFFRVFYEKYLFKNFALLFVMFLLMAALITSFVAIESAADAAWAEKNSASDALVPLAFPLPTEINQNFYTQVSYCFLPVSSLYGYDLRITSGFRDPKEQDQLYEQGRTVDGHIVTEVQGGRSLHNYGFAVDIVDRWHEYDIDWDKLDNIAFYCGLEPGDEGDDAHFAHRDGLAIEDFAAGRRPGLLTLPCAAMERHVKDKEPLTLEELEDCGASKF